MTPTRRRPRVAEAEQPAESDDRQDLADRAGAAGGWGGPVRRRWPAQRCRPAVWRWPDLRGQPAVRGDPLSYRPAARTRPGLGRVRGGLSDGRRPQHAAPMTAMSTPGTVRAARAAKAARWKSLAVIGSVSLWGAAKAWGRHRSPGGLEGAIGTRRLGVPHAGLGGPASRTGLGGPASRTGDSAARRPARGTRRPGVPHGRPAARDRTCAAPRPAWSVSGWCRASCARSSEIRSTPIRPALPSRSRKTHSPLPRLRSTALWSSDASTPSRDITFADLDPLDGAECEDPGDAVGHLLAQQVTRVLRDEDQGGVAGPAHPRHLGHELRPLRAWT